MDITKCSGESCRRKDYCYRNTCMAGTYHQSYFERPPVDAEGECEYFWLDEHAWIGKESLVKAEAKS